MKDEGTWTSIRALRGDALAEFIVLAEFGEKRVRAGRVLGYDYDPTALKQDDQRRRASLDEIEKGGDPLRYALASAVMPSRSHLPIIKVSLIDHEFSSEILACMPLDDEMWQSGNLRRIDLEDNRRHFHYFDICYWSEVSEDAQDRPDKYTLEGAMRLGLSGRYIQSDFGLILEMHPLVAGGMSYRQAAEKMANKAEGTNTEAESRIARLRKLYSQWEKLGG